MAKHSNQANESDAVLGGQNTVNPGDSDMVLGGLEALKQRLAADSSSNPVAEWENTYPYYGYYRDYTSPSAVKSALFSPDGNAIVFNNGNHEYEDESEYGSSRYDDDFVLWDWRKNIYLHTFSGWSSRSSRRFDAEKLSSFTTSPDGRFLACGGNYGTITLWNLSTGELLRTLEERSQSWSAWVYKCVDAVAFSPDGQILAGWKGIGEVGRFGTIQLWNPSTGELLRTLEGHSDRVACVAFSPDGQILASGSRDNTIKLWSLTTGKLLRTLEGHLSNYEGSSGSYNSNVNCVAVSPDGRVLASGGGDKSIKLWHLSTGDLLQTLEEDSAYIDCATLAFSPDGQILASGGSDSVIKLWNLSTGELLGSLEGRPNFVQFLSFSFVNSVAFSPDGRFLVSAIGTTVKVWRIR
jgi:WD40 repeat protein